MTQRAPKELTTFLLAQLGPRQSAAPLAAELQYRGGRSN